MRPLPHDVRTRVRGARGFTLLEMLVTLTVLSLVVITLSAVLLGAMRSKTSTTNTIESTQAARAAMDMIERDLRSAGYGVDLGSASPQPAIAYIDSMELILSANLSPYPDADAPNPPLAYDPDGNPRPEPLDGTSWEPPVKYRTGAELIRYTLDVDDDGSVDGNDIANANGVDARRTTNPSDFVLVRQVYGDSTGNVAGNNGGTMERIALVLKPGGDVPPMFRVWMRGSSTPYDWSGGAVPVAELADIERVEVVITAASGKPDWRHQYARTTLRTEINSMRNTPNFGEPEYLVDGFVFEDLNTDGVKNGTDVGLPGARVQLGGAFSVYSGNTGYFSFRVPAGTYVLRHTAPDGYGVWTQPDSFVVTVPGPQTRSFADTARTGGWVRALVFRDQNASGSFDAGEPRLPGIQVRLTGGNTAVTDANGEAALFAAPGSYTASVAVPDTMACTSINPQSGTMVDGGTAALEFGLQLATTGTVAGRVFKDNNRDGLENVGEPGLENVWVGVMGDGGLTTLGWAYTDAGGAYTITVPVNDPPRTKPYSVMCIPPGGYFPTTATSQGPVWVQQGLTTTGNDFGMAGYQIIRLDANRVLSLASTDLIEKDWNGNQTQNARKDADIVLGADAGGTDNVSVWFNRYDSSVLFNPTADYTRNAPNSVLALAVDTLDNGNVRPDVVTGTKPTAAGNFFIWYNQNTGGNEGILPSAYSSGQAYRTQDNGDAQVVLTFDCAGGGDLDLLVGTKSPTAYNGTVEIWQSNDPATPTFSRQEIYPTSGNVPGNRMGEVNAMVLEDLNNDGRRDLVVGTRNGAFSGEIIIFENVSKNNGTRFICRRVIDSPTEAITALACSDVDGDGWLDVVAGTQAGGATADLRQYRNKTSFDFSLVRAVAAPGIVLALQAADLGGSSRKDIVIGYREDVASYVGGLRIYYTDLGILPDTGVDPSGGSITNMVPALTSNNFNYGVRPSIPVGLLLTDFAAGVKVTSITGALVVFIR